MKTVKFNRPYPKQIEFFRSTSKYTAYGGARGGGKSWSARVKAVLLALNYPGIQILLLRRTFAELNENHTIPLRMLLGSDCYTDSSKSFTFPNGSRIKLGYCAAETDVLQYQGQAYDVIFMEEATQFTEFQYQALTESNRPSGLCTVPFSPRMYFTCNPGGVGHEWVKRLFVSRQYREKEQPEDYTFIKSLVYDNAFIMSTAPDYVRTLENLPEDRRKAMLYGDWDIFEGQYFTEFRREIHVVKPFVIPSHWRRYRTLDYGLDMLACGWIAINDNGKAFVYKGVYKPGLIISDAAKEILRVNGQDAIHSTFAPPDLWNRRQETGKSAADIFRENGVSLRKASNDRVQGWWDLLEWLHPYEDEQGITTASIVIFEGCCPDLVRTLPALQHDETNPNDTATTPHELTHFPDAIRYFVTGRPKPAAAARTPRQDAFFQREKPQQPAFGGTVPQSFFGNKNPSQSFFKGGR